MSDLKEQIKEAVKESKPYRKYRKILRRIEHQLDLRELEQEIKNLHFSRPIRMLKPTEVNQKTMIEACLKEVQARARLVEIRTSLLEHKGTLDELVGAVRKFLQTEYADILSKMFKSRVDRKEYFGRFFRGADEFMTEMDYLLKTIQYYVDDIDQAGYKCTNMTSLLEMIYNRGKVL